MKFRIKLPKWMDEKKEEKVKPSSIKKIYNSDDSWFDGIESTFFIKLIPALIIMTGVLLLGMNTINNLNDFVQNTTQEDKSILVEQNTTAASSAAISIIGFFPIIIIVMMGLVFIHFITSFLRDYGTI